MIDEARYYELYNKREELRREYAEMMKKPFDPNRRELIEQKVKTEKEFEAFCVSTLEELMIQNKRVLMNLKEA